MKTINYPVCLAAFAFLTFGFACKTDTKEKADKVKGENIENFAAREVRKYVYQRTGKLLEIGEDIIVFSQDENIDSGKLPENGDGFVLKTDGSLDHEEFALQTRTNDGHKILEISGGSPVAILYGVYECAEQMGIRFYLDGDVIPDEQIPFQIPDLNIRRKPLFSIRGIQPFHDFPEGPDWWSVDDYKAIITQLPKLKMNFIGFHTYPENKNFAGEGPKAEPMVWIGTEDQINADGTVKSAYPILHFNTTDNSWGYTPKKTSEYSNSASDFYPSDKYGALYMASTSDWPHSPGENIRIFNDFGRIQKEVFDYAAGLGVKICIGTETALTIPEKVKEHLKGKGVDPESDEAKKLVYRGIFERIKRTHPLDYYWFWTPEHWTWGEVKPEEVAATENDLRIAFEAAKEVNAPFELATCGWVIGPPPDRTKFDRILPREMPFSCINRNVGFEEIDESFLRIEGREKWAIPWMEDDPALIVPQLWAGRMRRDAADALAFGCTGLIGIHWRTRELGSNVSALARAAWSQEGWNPSSGAKISPEGLADYRKQITGDDSTRRDLSCKDHYLDWATAQFGPEKANEIAGIFSSLDGGDRTRFGGRKLTNLPRPADWVKGPGGLAPEVLLPEEADQRFRFLDDLENLRAGITGNGNLDRFDFWLNQFRYLREVNRLNGLLGRYNTEAKKIDKLPVGEQKASAENNLVPLRKTEMQALQQVHHFLMQTVTTKGTLGTVTNWQQHVIPIFFDQQGDELEKLLGRELNSDEMPYLTIETKIISFLSPPQSIRKGDDFIAEILMLNIENVEGTIYFRPPDKKKFLSLPLEHVNRGIYRAVIPGLLLKVDFEYYVEIKSGGKVEKVFPATSPDLNNYVTIK